MLNSLRPLLTKILNPLAKRMNVNPNIITIISPFIALLSALLYWKGFLLIGAIVILLSGLFDVVDGAIARYHGKNSDFGAFLDSTMDRFSDGIIIIGIIAGGYCSWFIGILLIHSAITVSYVRS
jgi:archaetidylinositol phosphate synthase